MVIDKVLVVTGDKRNGKFSEVISIGNTDITCQNFPNSPSDRDAACGGFVQNEVLICGGKHISYYLDDCWILGQTQKIKLIDHRGYSASIVLNDKVSNFIMYLQG